MLCLWVRVRKSAFASGFDLFNAPHALQILSLTPLNIVASHLLYLVQLAPCGFNGIYVTPFFLFFFRKKERKRFAALGTRVDAPQCLIRVIRLAASAPRASQQRCPMKHDV